MNTALISLEIAVLVLAFGILLLDLWLPAENKRKLGYVAALGAGAILVASYFWLPVNATFTVGTTPFHITLPSLGDNIVMDLPALFFKFLRFGALAFGGPVAQIAMIRHALVDQERWIDSARFNRLPDDQPFSAAAELMALGPVFDQDMRNMVAMTKGMKASRKGAVSLATYQESRIRHHHLTLDKYLGSGSAK